MSKAKKDAYAAKEKEAAAAAAARRLVPVGDTAPTSKQKPAKTRKQSRGK